MLVARFVLKLQKIKTIDNPNRNNGKINRLPCFSFLSFTMSIAKNNTAPPKLSFQKIPETDSVK